MAQLDIRTNELKEPIDLSDVRDLFSRALDEVSD